MPGSIELSPCWRIVSGRPGEGDTLDDRVNLYIEPGLAFGSGRHPSTQLCLLALGHQLRGNGGQKGSLRVLDVGSGSGILAIAAARLGGTVDAVEIDVAALDCARRNADLNGVQTAVAFSTRFPSPPPSYDFVLANILAGVLLDLAPELAMRVAPSGHLVLSGLTATDTPAILARYRPLLPGWTARLHRREEWCAVWWSPD